MAVFARRTNNWEGESNALDKALHATPASFEICDLTQSNPSKVGIHYPSQWLNALNHADVMDYDPQSFGLSQTRRAICDYYKKRGYVINPEHIVLTSGSSESYAYLFRLFINPQDKVLIPTPSYPLFPYLLDMHDAKYDTYTLNMNSQWTLNRYDLLEKLDPTVKIIMIVSPNNPTGSYMGDEDMMWLCSLAQERNLVLVADEVFMDYALQEKGKSFLSSNECLCCVIGGLSKTLCLPGMKLGWLILSGPKHEVDEALKRLEIMTDTMLSVNTPVQIATPQWLQDVDEIQEQVLKRLRINLDYALQNCPDQVILFEPQGGWYVIVQLPEEMDDEQFCLSAIEKGVSLYPGYFFDMPDDRTIIVSLLTKEEIFVKGWNIFSSMFFKEG